MASRKCRKVTASPSPASSSSSSSYSAEKVASIDDLLIQILARLPTKPLFKFRTVSRSWNTLISSHLSALWKPKPPSGFLALEYGAPKYNLIRLDHKTERKPPTANRLNLPTKNSPSVRILDSCNGLLLCYREGSFHYLTVHDNLTRHYTTIPSPEYYYHMEYKRRGCYSMYLVADLSSAPHFHVVDVSFKQDRYGGNDIVLIEMYSSLSGNWTLYSQTWRDDDIIFDLGVVWSSAIHWPSSTSEKSLYFDVYKGLLEAMPMPPIQEGGEKRRNVFYFGESNGHLHLIDFNARGLVSDFDVFEMEKDYSKWFVKYHVDLNAIARNFPSIAESDGKLSNFEVLCVVRRAKPALVMYIPGAQAEAILYQLDDEHKTCKRLCQFQKERAPVHQYIENSFWSVASFLSSQI